MKLSKAQQEVVNKMRNGWNLYYSTLTNLHWLIKDGVTSYINSTPVKAMIRNGVVQVSGIPGVHIHYRLTEQYKTEQK